MSIRTEGHPPKGEGELRRENCRVSHWEAIWIVSRVVQATTFFARQGTFNNKLGAVKKITKLKQIPAHLKVNVIILNLILQKLNTIQCALSRRSVRTIPT